MAADPAPHDDLVGVPSPVRPSPPAPPAADAPARRPVPSSPEVPSSRVPSPTDVPSYDGSTDPVPWTGVAAADGTVLRFVVDGPTDAATTPVLLCNGIACSDAYWYAVGPLLAADRAVVRWDYRGHGRSADPVDRSAIGPDTMARDALAVLDAAGVESVAVVGHSYGVQVALEVARRAPERTRAVVAVAGAPGRPLARGADHQRGDLLVASLRGVVTAMPRLARLTWDALWDAPAIARLARLLGTTTAHVPNEVLSAYFAHVRDRDPDLLLEMMQEMGSHSARDVVGGLPVPLLVLAGDRDRLTPLDVLRSTALAAPDGQLAVRHGGSHTLPAEHPAWVVGELAAFLADRVDPLEASP